MELLKKAQKLRPAHLLAAAFLLYIGFVALYYKSLTDTSVGMNKGDFRILITRDKENRILTVEDNGIGMTKEELEQNLGTIAHSGSLDFKKDNKDENIDIIGQFGVGFYSAFMVADKLTVISKAYGSDEAWQWESSGVDGYEMPPAQKDTVGCTGWYNFLPVLRNGFHTFSAYIPA